MRKPDDELKINISELFGGDLPSPSETLDDITLEQTSVVSQVPSKILPDVKNQFQEWMDQRNQEPEAETLEVENKYIETLAPTNQEAENLKRTLAQKPPSAIETMPAATDSPVDFNAPIVPPFMGAIANPDNLQGSKAEEPISSVETPVLESPQNIAEVSKLQAEHEFLMLYDEFRNIIFYELKDLVGDKKTLTMLGRTVELARGKFPEVLRNVNWDSAGNLLEDGSVNGQRIIENKKTIDPKKADEVVDAALSGLLKLRLQAVEKGLGSGLKNKVRAHMYQWISEKTQKAVSEGKDETLLKRLSGYVAAT